MNLVGYDVMTIGNHDLEYKEVLLSHEYNFSMISVNIIDFKKSVIIDRNGIKIGFIGYTITENFNEDTIKVVTTLIINEAKSLRPLVDLTVLLGHGGIILDKYISNIIHDHIDIILGGHSHVLRSCEGLWHEHSSVVHSGSNGAYLGILSIQIINNDSYYLTSNNINMNDIKILPDQYINNWLQPLFANITKSSSLIFDFTNSYVDDNKNCRYEVCNTGIIISLAVKWYSFLIHTYIYIIIIIIIRYFNYSAYCFIESGSIRRNFNDKPFRTNDILEMLPWDNKMIIMSISGNDLLNVLLHSHRGGQTGNGGYLQSSTNVLYYDDDEIYFNDIYYNINSNDTYESNIKIDSTKTYYIVVTDWLESGGDGYSVLNPNTSSSSSSVSIVARSTESLREIVSIYLQKISNHHIDIPWNSTTLTTLLSSKTSASASASASKPTSPIWFHSIFHGLIGVFAEIISLVITYPLVTLVSRRQANSDHKGDLYDGFMLTMICRLASTVLYWYFYYFMLEAFTLDYIYIFTRGKPNGNKCISCTATVAFLSSTAAGIINVVVTNPLWVITTYLQVHGKYPETLKQLCDGLWINILLIAYPSIRQLFQESLIHLVKLKYNAYHNHAIVAGVMGILSNIVATILTYPLQTIRTRIQAKISLPSVSTSTSTSLMISSSTLTLDQQLNEFLNVYYKGFSYKILSVILYGFIFYYTQKLLNNIFM